MNPSLFSYIAWFFVLIGAQVLVCNHIHLLGYAMPMIYVYFLMILPGNISRCGLLILAFILGLLVDMFSKTPGMATSAIVFTALLRPLVLMIFAPSERSDGVFYPSVRTMEFGGFLRYALTISLLQTTTFYVIEAFSFFHLATLFWNILSSTLLTTLLILALEMLRNKR